MKPVLILLCLLFPGFAIQTVSQTTRTPAKTPVMILGTFHFAYPNQDVVKAAEKDQMNVLSPMRQAEIERIVQQLAGFRPTKIIIERPTTDQARMDSLYQCYLKNQFLLEKGEEYQIGFRLAKQLQLDKLYCGDTWGNLENFYTTTDGRNFQPKEEKKATLQQYDAYIDSVFRHKTYSFAGSGKGKEYTSLHEILREMNQAQQIRQANYLYYEEMFLFESRPYDYFGVDYLAATWYNRNLRIFRNLVRFTDSDQDRILVIYGAGHHAPLKQLIEDSPSHEYVSVLGYLKNGKGK